MFTLVRIHVPSTVTDSTGRHVTHPDPNHIWEFISRNHEKMRTEDVRLLYMTRRHLQDDTSLIIEAKDTDALSDFINKHLAHLKYVRGIRVINMSKMRFFKVPLEHPSGFFRFTITIDALPSHLEKVYDTIAALKPGRDIVVNYIAQTFQSFDASIMVSVLARSKNHMDVFVDDCIRPLPGVVDAEITHISKTMRLVSPSEWEQFLGAHFITAEGEQIKDIDPYRDDSLIAGC